MRKLRNYTITILTVIAAFWLLQKSKVIPSLKDIFEAKPVVIDETPVLIKDIKSIGQLITYSFYDEAVADSLITTRGSAFVNAFNRLAPVPMFPSADKQLVLIGRGKVLAGINLSLLTDTSLIIKNDTITLTLPKPQIFSTVLNPGDFETFIEEGNWTNEEVTLVKLKARRMIEARALQQNILGRAEMKAKAVLQNFLGNMGFKKVLLY